MPKGEEVRYGCHCDLDPDAQPDGCVLDYGVPGDCIHAPSLVAAGKGREACCYWKPVAVDENCAKSEAEGYINTNAHLEAKVALLEHDLAEQCRLLGLAGEREARLMAAVAELQQVVATQSALRHEALALEAQLRHEVGLCYRMLLSEPDTKGALFKAENLLREALALPQDDTALREMIESLCAH